MLAVGSQAPEIDAVTSTGARFRLSEQARRCTVLYFFPAAFTPGCTKETKEFAHNYNELQLLGAGLVGISTDDHDTQCKFADSLHAPFPMIGDADKSITTAYDVRWPLIGRAQRVTYVVSDKRVILAAFHHEIQVGKHNEDVMLFVDALSRQRRE